MKKLTLSFIVALFGFIFLRPVETNAQFMAGAGLAWGSEIEQPGIKVQGIYDLNNVINLGADFIYYFPNSSSGFDFNWWEFNANRHYVFKVNNFMFYGLAGLNIAGLSFDTPTITGPFGTIGGGDVSNTEIGLNIGVGGLYPVSNNINLDGELKYVLGTADQLVIAVTVLFNIGG